MYLTKKKSDKALAKIQVSPVYVCIEGGDRQFLQCMCVLKVVIDNFSSVCVY